MVPPVSKPMMRAAIAAEVVVVGIEHPAADHLVDDPHGRAHLAVDVVVEERALLGVGDRAEHEQPDRGEREDAGDQPSAQRDDHARGGLRE